MTLTSFFMQQIAYLAGYVWIYVVHIDLNLSPWRFSGIWAQIRGTPKVR